MRGVGVVRQGMSRMNPIKGPLGTLEAIYLLETCMTAEEADILQCNYFRRVIEKHDPFSENGYQLC